MKNKNTHLLFCLLFTSITIQCMNQQLTVQNKQDDPWKSVDISAMNHVLKNDYKTYLTNRLIEYKKNDFTSQDLDQIENMYFHITNAQQPSELKRYLHNYVVDEKQNSFLHVAIKKKDVTVLRWLTTVVQCSSHKPNADGKGPIDLCIEQMMPDAQESDREKAHEMLDLLTDRYNKVNFCLEWRKAFLHKMLQLQYAHTKNATTFKLKEALFQRFLTDIYNSYQPIALSKLYQETADPITGDTFTHIFVEQGNADTLHKLLQQGYASPAKNKDGKTPVDSALILFNAVTQSSHFDTMITIDWAEYNRRRCCLFMLVHYAAKQQQLKCDLEQCCSAHTL
jgi:hypothetical protein